MQDLAAVVTGRSTSLFDEAFDEVTAQLRENVAGKNLLFTGGAGFIGTQTLKVLLQFEPRSVVIADSSENMLAELVREVRSSGALTGATRIEPRLVDITGPLVDRLWEGLDPIDSTYQFAAAKHVRSERDPVSLLRMIQVNLNGTMRLTRSLVESSPNAKIFVVSTDKAADPSSLMGASKRLMEMAILGQYPVATTTRFANVAFSNGSLLESWVMRLREGQPLAVPADTWRYFVSPQEAGQVCAIASAAPAGSIVVPDEAETGNVELESALMAVLAHLGLDPVFVPEEEALDAARYGETEVPIVRSLRDTAGEKREEKFVATNDVRTDWLPNVGVVTTSHDAEAAEAMAAWVDVQINGDKALTVADISDAVAEHVPEFRHISSAKRLDDRL